MARDPIRVGRTAALTIVNAMIFQQVLSEYDKRVPPLRNVIADVSPVERLASVWEMILTDIDYIPIFRLARDLVVELSGTPGVNDALQTLARAAQRVTARRAALRHDLMGRIFHKLLTDAKYFGAFYTTVPAAALLLKLTLDPSVVPIDWSNVEGVRSLRIGDLASGTGTLLKAALQTVVDNNVRASAEQGRAPALKEIHKVLLEEVLYGLDVVPFAIHLAATALALHEPEVPFGTMNLFTVPLEAPSNRSVRLGSIELFHSRRIPIQADLLGAVTPAATRVTGAGDRPEVVEVPKLDLCVMNPPFTRSVGGNLLFGNLPETMRKVMQRDLRKMVKSYHIEASITAGLGSVFTALGHRLLRPEGQLALVLPRAVLAGVAWAPTRGLLARHYHVRAIVVSHEPNGWNFSENTELSECLIVAKRLRDGEEPGPTKVVNLWRRPKNSIEALAMAQQVIKARGASLEGDGSDDLTLGSKKFGEVVLIEPARIRAGRLNEGSAFAQTDLSRVIRFLSQGRVWTPGRGCIGEAPMTPLSEVAEIGPDRRDVHDGFRLSGSETSYAAFWGHDADSVTRIAQHPNKHLAALTRPRHSRPHRDAALLWSRAGRLFVTERLWLITLRLVSVLLPNKALSNTWWPLVMKRGGAETRLEDEQILALWLNSSLGILTIMGARVDTRGPWIQMKKPLLERLPVLDPSSLERRQRTALTKLYHSLANHDFLRLPQVSRDQARARLDEGIMAALGLSDNLASVREMLSREPILSV